ADRQSVSTPAGRATAADPMRAGARAGVTPPSHRRLRSARSRITPGPTAAQARCASGSLLAIDELPPEARVPVAAHLVLERERHLARVRIDDVLEAELVVANAFRDEVPLLQVLERSREI